MIDLWGFGCPKIWNTVIIFLSLDSQNSFEKIFSGYEIGDNTNSKTKRIFYNSIFTEIEM